MDQVGTWHGGGRGSDHIVLDGDLAPLFKKWAEPLPIFRPFLLWPNGWIHQDVTWYAARPQPRRFCVRWGPSQRPKKGAEPLPNFWPISIVAKRLDASRCHLVWR